MLTHQEVLIINIQLWKVYLTPAWQHIFLYMYESITHNIR